MPKVRSDRYVLYVEFSDERRYTFIPCKSILDAQLKINELLESGNVLTAIINHSLVYDF